MSDRRQDQAAEHAATAASGCAIIAAGIVGALGLFFLFGWYVVLWVLSVRWVN